MKLSKIKRSRAYRRASRGAADYLSNPAKLTHLLEIASAKADKYHSGQLAEVWESLKAILRLIKHYAQGSYRDVSWQTLLLLITALVYFVIPTDAIPDILLGWGLLDDVTLLGWVINSSRKELERFLQWENRQMAEPSAGCECEENSEITMRQDEPTKQHFEINGVNLNVYEWAGSGDPLVLFHATGFHGRCWDYIVRRLPADVHVYAVDCPGHGLSDTPNMPFTWDILSEDMALLMEQLDIRNASLVGHSFGGYAATMVAAKLPERFKRVLLLDPVILDPAVLELIESMSDMEHPVARRRNQWGSVEEMIEAFAKRAPYNNWHPQVLDDYCRFGLIASDGEAELELACPPFVEAEIYVQSGCGNAYTDAAKVRAPVHILRARDRRADDSPFDFSPSPTWSELHTKYPDATDIHLKDMSHFFPMENPDQLSQLLNQWLVDGSVVWPE